jgi:Ca2+-binding RTX toxin-like protein
MTTYRTALALGLGASALTLLPAPVAHAAATCQGQPATIEASTGTVAGTSGDDVIVVSDDAFRVEAKEGDDLVCVAGNTEFPDDLTWLAIDAGPGDDFVDTTSAGAKSDSTLGAGSDTFVGGPFDDRVRIGTVAPGDTDEVSTGAGDDYLLASNIELGPTGTFDLGAGRDGVGFYDDYDFPGARGNLYLFVDLVAESMRWRGVTATLRGAEDVGGLARRITVRGNAEDNRVFAMGCQVMLRGAAGADRLSMRISHSLDEQPFRCGRNGKTGHWRALGNGGDDYLHGGNQHDVLIGGPGRDVADGWKHGDDVCKAEKVKGKGCLG